MHDSTCPHLAFSKARGRVKDVRSGMETYIACRVCGLMQTIEPLPPRASACCARCGFTLVRRKNNSLTRTAALAIGALILFFPANLYPIVTTEYWGAQQKTTIFDGIRGLFQTGQWPIGCLVFTTSILSPIMKISGLLLLVVSIRSGRFKKFRSWVYRIIQIVGPWNMLEVYLLSILVAVAELGKVATVHPGFGVISFAAVVVLTITATLTFDPRLIWDQNPEEGQITEQGNRHGAAH
jgi:paraquat-inducible protein A